MTDLRAPFPWFGGKSKIAPLVWERFGDVQNYVEPFFGSGAVLLGRPTVAGIETVNDLDCMVANFWRALQNAPDAVAEAADWPVNECVPVGTMIATPIGQIPVESIIPGMFVFGERNGSVTPTVVTGIHSQTAADFVQIGDRLRVTGNHPVWTPEGYIAASELRGGNLVKVLDTPVNDTDLSVLYYEYEQSGVGDLRIGRSEDRGDEVRGCDVSRKAAIERALIAGDTRGEDVQGSLASGTDSGGTSPYIFSTGGRDYGRLGDAGEVLDSKASNRLSAYESDGRRRGGAGLSSDHGIAPEMVCDAEGRTLSSGAEKGNARQNPHDGGAGEDTSGGTWQEADATGESQVIGGAHGQAVIGGASGEVIDGTHRENSHARAQGQNIHIHDEPEAGVVCRDRTEVRFDNGGGAGIVGNGSIGGSGNTQGMLLQRKSLPVPVAVYNFSTETGNYFAEGILVHNCDQHARHLWLVSQEEFRENMKTDPEFYDAKIAGWWVWGQCIWIGSGWCSVQLPHLGNAGMGIHRKRPHLGNAGKGINRQLPHLGNAGMGDALCLEEESACPLGTREFLFQYMGALAERLRRVRVCCGDWSRVCGPTPTVRLGITGAFLDPPYLDGRTDALYSSDSLTVAHEVREWAIAQGDDPRIRIALCGYEGEHDMPGSWDCVEWKARGGYGSQGENRARKNSAKERVYFSPHCLRPAQERLFA